jgi:hypothetical protein
MKTGWLRGETLLGALAAVWAQGLAGLQLIPSKRVARGSGKLRFASHHLEGNAYIDPHSLPAYEALAKHLMGGGR